MRTICVIVDMFEALFQMEQIRDNFPCFINTNRLTDTYVEVSIQCREEDAEAIENILSEVV